jgi:pentatricopeptide repeat protein
LAFKACTATADAYAKIGHLAQALMVLDEMPEKNVVFWTMLVGAQFCRHDVLGRFAEMHASGCVPCDSNTCAAAVTMCTGDASLLS